MSKSDKRKARHGKAGFAAIWVLFVVSACGIGLDTSARLERCQKAYDSGEYRAAAVDAKVILRDNPDNIEARLLLGRSAMHIGDARSAKKEFRRAMALGADPGEVAADLGRALLMLGEFEQVEIEITADLAVDADSKLAILRVRGDALLAQGRPAEAEKIYTAILAERGDDLDTMLAVASTSVAMDDVHQARVILDEVLARDATFIPAWLASGTLWAQQKDFAQSEADFAKAADLAVEKSDLNGQIKAMSGTVEVRLAQKNLQDAKQTVASLTELAPGNLSVQFLAARVSYLEEDWVAASQQLQSILRKNADYAPARDLLGVVHLRRGNLVQAEIYLAATVAATPPNQNARRLLAEVLLQQYRDDAAAHLLRPMLIGESVDPTAPAKPSRASIGFASLDEVIGFLKTGFGEDSGDISTSVKLVSLFARSGDTEGAIRTARALLRRHPDSVGSKIVLAELLYSDNQNIEASRMYDEALQLDSSRDVAVRAYRLKSDSGLSSPEEPLLGYLSAVPADSEVRMILAQEYQARHNDVNAVNEFERVVAAAPNNSVALERLAWIYFTQNDSRAEALARRAYELSPNSSSVVDTLGWVLVNNGSLREGIAYLREAVDLANGEAEIRFHLAAGLARSGAVDEARQLLAEILSDGDEFSWRGDAKTLLSKL